jgi:hypothetical protein
MIVGEGDAMHRTGHRPADLVVELPDDDTVDLLVFGLGKSYREYAVSHGDGRGQWNTRDIEAVERDAIERDRKKRAR